MEEIQETLSALSAEAPPEIQRLIDAARGSEDDALDDTWRELLEEALREA